MEYETIIGLEVHAQLLTESKIFCGCSTKFGAPPNQQTCPVCLGMPGVLPVLNKKAVELALRAALATHCKIALRCTFARKNYFYPDLPKGYQISQYEQPLCRDGYIEIEIDGKSKKIGIIRIHLEEDAGKSIHAEEWVSADETLVDLNRCGVPLIEVVSAPDIRSPKEAYLYLIKLKQILQYLEISDCNMEEGSLRCDANVSVRPLGRKEFGVKTEVKNMNSFHGVERALEFEVERQKKILDSGGTIVQETMLWDANKNLIVPMRSKEEAHDYRYFPEPDLVPLEIHESWLQEIRKTLPEMPTSRRDRFIREYTLPKYDAEILTSTRELADYYEECVKYAPDPKLASNWVMSEVLRFSREEKVELKDFSVKPKQLGEMLHLIADGTISGKIAKTVFEEMVKTGDSAKTIVAKKGLVQVSDRGEIERVVEKVLKTHPKEVEQYRAGKDKLLGFFVGQVMKATKGKANPKVANEVLLLKLKGSK